MKLFTVIAGCGLLWALAQGVSAEVITIPLGRQGGDLQHIARPERGMSSAAVLARFGEPMAMTPARGEPPISHWAYENFTVYFESEVVIHSVLRHTPKHLPAE